MAESSLTQETRGEQSKMEGVSHNFQASTIPHVGNPEALSPLEINPRGDGGLSGPEVAPFGLSVDRGAIVPSSKEAFALLSLVIPVVTFNRALLAPNASLHLGNSENHPMEPLPPLEISPPTDTKISFLRYSKDPNPPHPKPLLLSSVNLQTSSSQIPPVDRHLMVVDKMVQALADSPHSDRSTDDFSSNDPGSLQEVDNNMTLCHSRWMLNLQPLLVELHLRGA